MTYVNMLLSLSAQAAETGKSGFVWIGHDLDGWTVALIAAVVGAFIYEMIMALTRAVTMRIPFLVLRVARLSVPEELRSELYARWESELWYILIPGDKGWFARLLVVRFIAGMIYAVPIALFGARAQSRLFAPSVSVAETSAQDSAGSRKRQEAKHRAWWGSPFIGAFIGVMLVMMLALTTVALFVYVTVDGDISRTVMAVAVGVAMGSICVPAIRYLRRDRS